MLFDPGSNGSNSQLRPSQEEVSYVWQTQKKTELATNSIHESRYFFKIMDTADLRQYLSFPPRGSAVEVMRDAVETQVLGAVWLLELVLSVRVNRKTRRQLRDVADAFASP